MNNTEKDFIKDGLENDKIIDTIKKIRNVVEVNCNDEIIGNLRKEHEFFYQRYPILFDIATRTNEPFNWNYLNYFLSMRSKIINDELTSDKASVIVGEEWFQRHVKLGENQELDPPTRFVRRKKFKNNS
jgi:hypothetical protein